MTKSSQPSGTVIAFVGATLGAVIGCTPMLWGMTDRSMEVLVWAGLVGIPTGAILGFREGPRIRVAGARDVPYRVGLMALPAALLPGIVVGTLLAIAGLASGPVGLIVLPLAVLYSTLAVLITLPCATAWTVVIRLLPSSWMAGTPTPMRSGRARLTAISVLVVLAGLGGIPHLTFAVGGATCADLDGRASLGSWTPDGRAIFVSVERDDGLRSSVAAIDAYDGSVRVVHRSHDWIGSLTVDGAGRPAWLEMSETGSALWTADPLPTRVGATVGLDWASLAWFDGDLVVIDRYETGRTDLRVLEVAGGRVAATRDVAPWSDPPTTDLDFGPALSGDGSTAAWMDDAGAAFVSRGGRVHRLPVATWLEGLSFDGSDLIVQGETGWELVDVDAPSGPVARLTDEAAESSEIAVYGDRVAWVRSGFRAGDVCFQDVAPSLGRARPATTRLG